MFGAKLGAVISTAVAGYALIKKELSLKIFYDYYLLDSTSVTNSWIHTLNGKRFNVASHVAGRIID